MASVTKSDFKSLTKIAAPVAKRPAAVSMARAIRHAMRMPRREPIR